MSVTIFGFKNIDVLITTLSAIFLIILLAKEILFIPPPIDMGTDD